MDEKYPKKVKVQCINCDWFFWAEIYAEGVAEIVDCPKCGNMVNTEEDKVYGGGSSLIHTRTVDLNRGF